MAYQPMKEEEKVVLKLIMNVKWGYYLLLLLAETAAVQPILEIQKIQDPKPSLQLLVILWFFQPF